MGGGQRQEGGLVDSDCLRPAVCAPNSGLTADMNRHTQMLCDFSHGDEETATHPS